MNIIISKDQWDQSRTDENVFLRIDPDKPRLYRKTEDPALFGGYKIEYCGCKSRLAHEWAEKHFGI